MKKEDLDRIIFHIDVNNAFLSWEAVKRLEENPLAQDIRKIPCIIGGDVSKRHGVVLAKSMPAKKMGVKTGEPISSAYKKCPNLFVFPGNYPLYLAKSKELMDLLNRWAPTVEQVSVDEAFCDFTGTSRIYPDVIKLAKSIQKEIRTSLGFSVNIGIAPNKFLAKMASDFEKPDKIHTLWTREIPHKLWNLPVQKQYGIGKKTAKGLEKLGYKLIGDIAKADPYLLEKHFNKQGVQIYRYSHGIDDEPVIKEQEKLKQYGNSTTLPENVISLWYMEKVVFSLCEGLSVRLRKDKVVAGCLTLLLRDEEFVQKTMQRKMLVTNEAIKMYTVAMEIVQNFWDQKTPIRLVGVSLSCLEAEGGMQMSIWDVQPKKKRLEETMDILRDKFGENAIKRAIFLEKDKEEFTP